MLLCCCYAEAKDKDEDVVEVVGPVPQRVGTSKGLLSMNPRPEICTYMWMQSLKTKCQKWTSSKLLVWEAKGEARGQAWLSHQATIAPPLQTLQGRQPVCQRSEVPADICQELMSATARWRKVSSASQCVPLGASGWKCEQTPDGYGVRYFLASLVALHFTPGDFPI